MTDVQLSIGGLTFEARALGRKETAESTMMDPDRVSVSYYTTSWGENCATVSFHNAGGSSLCLHTTEEVATALAQAFNKTNPAKLAAMAKVHPEPVDIPHKGAIFNG